MWFSNLLKQTRVVLTGPSLLIFAFALLISGCASKLGEHAVSSYNNQPLSVTIPSNASAEFVENAMVKTLTGRKWNVQSQTKDKVVGRLVHRGYDATVNLVSNGSSIRILSDATHKDISSDEVRPAVPLGWLENIQKDLGVALSAPR